MSPLKGKCSMVSFVLSFLIFRFAFVQIFLSSLSFEGDYNNYDERSHRQNDMQEEEKSVHLKIKEMGKFGFRLICVCCFRVIYNVE